MGDVAIHWQEDPSTGVLTASASWAGPNGQPITLSASGNVHGLRAKLMAASAPKLKQVLAALRSPALQQQAVSGQLAQVHRVAQQVTKKKVAQQLAGKVKHALARSGPFFPHAARPPVQSVTKTAAVANAAMKVIQQSKAGNPAAKTFVRQVVQKAAQGAPDAKALASVLSRFASQPTAAGGCGVSGLDEASLAASSCFGDTVSGAFNPIYAAQQVYIKAKRGDAKAKKYIGTVLAQANKGDKDALKLRDLLAQSSKLGTEEHAPRAVSGSNLFEHTAPMNVKNYYTISGQDIGPFWGDNTLDLNPTMEIAVGANGKVMAKRWDGAKWIWDQVRGHNPIRNRNQIFGVRDAYLQGMGTMQARALY